MKKPHMSLLHICKNKIKIIHHNLFYIPRKEKKQSKGWREEEKGKLGIKSTGTCLVSIKITQEKQYEQQQQSKHKTWFFFTKLVVKNINHLFGFSFQ